MTARTEKIVAALLPWTVIVITLTALYLWARADPYG